MSRQQAKTVFSELFKNFKMSTCCYVQGKRKKGVKKNVKYVYFPEIFMNFECFNADTLRKLGFKND